MDSKQAEPNLEQTTSNLRAMGTQGLFIVTFSIVTFSEIVAQIGKYCNQAEDYHLSTYSKNG